MTPPSTLKRFFVRAGCGKRPNYIFMFNLKVRIETQEKSTTAQTLLLLGFFSAKALYNRKTINSKNLYSFDNVKIQINKLARRR